MKTLFYLSCAGVLFASCKNESTPIVSSDTTTVAETSSVIQPIAGLETEIRKFKVNASENSKIDLPNGGSIVFPAHAFVAADGRQIDGEVEIEWQEFHSLTDILLSGIPMKYDSLGNEYDFVSGGMFTIDASQDGKDIDLAEGKKATVNLASYDDTPCYNFYKLNEENGDWSYKDTRDATPLMSNEPKRESQNKKTTVTNNVLDVEVDISEYDELKELDIVGWEALKPIRPETHTQLVHSDNVAQLKGMEGNYVLEVKNKNGMDHIPVRPYTLEQANAQRKKILEKLERDYAELLAYQENVAQGKVVRSIDIDGMGTYNWDKVLKRDQEIVLATQYDFPVDQNTDFISVFFISPDENVVISCNAKGDHKFKFDPSKKNYLVAILKDNDVLMVDDKGFNGARSKKGGLHTFSFADTGMKVNSPEELGVIMKSVMGV